MREATIATSLPADFLAHLARRGQAPEAVCREAGVDLQAVTAPNARVPTAVMQRLWEAGERLTGDVDLGLHSAETYNPGALNIVGYVLLSCRSAGDALDRLARYAPLLNEGLTVQLQSGPDDTRCRFAASPAVAGTGHPAPRQTMEALAAGIVLTLQRLASPTPLPRAVNFRHAEPADTREHRRLLGPSVHFGQAHDEVVYASAALEAGMVSADPALLAVFEADARQRLDRLAEPGHLVAQVQALLRERLKGTVPPLARLAADMAMSERALQRRLRDEGRSYRELLDAVRQELALAHLARPGTTATDVAFLLGFSEPSAFTRAFRRWTGSAPTQFRTG